MSNSMEIPFLVTFYNGREYAINFGRPNKIFVEYVVNPQHRVTCKDWVGVFPNDCSFQNSVNFDRMVSYEFVLHRPVSKKEMRYKMVISLEGARNLNFDEKYVFVYFNSESELLGVSDTFVFVDPAARKILPWAQREHGTPHSNSNQNNHTHNEQYRNNKFAKGRNLRSKGRFFSTPDEIPVEKYSLGEDEENIDVNQQGHIHKSKNKKFNQSHSNKVQGELVTYSADRFQSFTSCKPNFNCSNCQRVGPLLKTQSDLYMQVKNLAEINSELTGKIQQLEKQIELAQAAYQKQSVLLMRERESRLFYQNRAKDNGQANQTSGDGELAVTDGGRARSEEKGKVTHHMLKLKAVIGNQEEKLQALSEKLTLEEDKVRSLTQQLQEIQYGKVQKVKAVMKDTEDLSCGDNAFNNNVGEDEAVDNNK